MAIAKTLSVNGVMVGIKKDIGVDADVGSRSAMEQW